LTTTAGIQLLEKLTGVATATATIGEAGLAIQERGSQTALPLARPDGRAKAAGPERRWAAGRRRGTLKIAPHHGPILERLTIAQTYMV
jgi:hypothetical protein